MIILHFYHLFYVFSMVTLCSKVPVLIYVSSLKQIPFRYIGMAIKHRILNPQRMASEIMSNICLIITSCKTAILKVIAVVTDLIPYCFSSPPQNWFSCSSGSGKERSPRGGEQPAAGQREQGCDTAAEPEHPSDRDHL